MSAEVREATSACLVAIKIQRDFHCTRTTPTAGLWHSNEWVGASNPGVMAELLTFARENPQEDTLGVVEEYEKIRWFSVLIVGQDPSL